MSDLSFAVLRRNHVPGRGRKMSNDAAQAPGVVMLDELIARARASCVRTQAELAATPSRSLRVLIRRQGQLRIMQDTLARLVAERQAP